MTQLLWYYAVDIWGDPVALVSHIPISEALIPVFDGTSEYW